ncbi:hypothetical protein IH992_03790 [Candidatus Poribacteria bacterium]|nr:hypothetical protein [Candidatus Poribacteria bacterium]
MAVDAVGLHYDTFRRWRNAGESAKSGAKREFYLATERAISESRKTLEKVIYNAATTVKIQKETRVEESEKGKKTTIIEKEVLPDASYALEILRRWFPEDWEAKGKMEISTKGGKPLPIAIISDEIDLDKL